MQVEQPLPGQQLLLNPFLCRHVIDMGYSFSEEGICPCAFAPPYTTGGRFLRDSARKPSNLNPGNQSAQ